MVKRQKRTVDESTEQKIKDAARKVFIRNGYSGTTTRAIADEAGINSALLNYYFRSKEKLFDIVMKEQMVAVLGKVFPIINQPDTTLEQKVQLVISYYTTLLLEEPGLMLFVLSELQNQPERVVNHIEANQGMMHSVMARQFKEAKPNIHPMQLLMSVMGMGLFPFMARGVLQRTSGLDDKAFEKMLKERQTILPPLIMAMLEG